MSSKRQQKIHAQVGAMIAPVKNSDDFFEMGCGGVSLVGVAVFLGLRFYFQEGFGTAIGETMAICFFLLIPVVMLSMTYEKFRAGKVTREFNRRFPIDGDLEERNMAIEYLIKHREGSTGVQAMLKSLGVFIEPTSAPPEKQLDQQLEKLEEGLDEPILPREETPAQRPSTTSGEKSGAKKDRPVKAASQPGANERSEPLKSAPYQVSETPGRKVIPLEPFLEPPPEKKREVK